MFPDEELLGVDIIVPDITYLLEHKSEVKAILLTHGHEDHIGALPFILPYLNVPIYGSSFTMALVKSKLEQHGMLQAKRSSTRSRRSRRSWSSAVSASSSFTSRIRSSMRLRSRSRLRPASIIHTGDFKIDPTPIDGKTVRSPHAGRLRRSGRSRAVLRQHECGAFRIHGIGTHGQRPIRVDLPNVERTDHSFVLHVVDSATAAGRSIRRSSTIASSVFSDDAWSRTRKSPRNSAF